jgi:hypothetical protein
MFAIDNREIKSELLKKLNDILTILLKSLEESIITLYNTTLDKYSKIHKLIDKRLNSPEELVEMEKVKNYMSNELFSIQKDFDDAYKIYIYLFKIDHYFSDTLINKTEEAMKRHIRFKRELEE